MKQNLLFKLLLLIISFSTAQVVFAQVAVTGTVKDNNGKAVVDASVIIKETGNGSTTDANGKFALQVGQRKSITIEVSSIGFESQSKVITIQGSSVSADFVMKAGGTSLGNVVITATNSRRTQQVTPMSITSLSQAKIAQVKFNSQADILRAIPGITAEGGGGELASNIFVRGLPSGGQFQFTPLQIDGMPVVATMGLNSSAPDVYFRNDLGINNIEFVRGGASTLFGMGSVAGIINYISKTGTETQKTVIEMETATPGRARFDFNTGGPINDKQLYYNVSGTYRYDEGPIKSGLSTDGYQLRGNLKKVLANGSFTLSGQYIDDRAQFFLPYPLNSDRSRPTGWDGKTIMTLQTSDIRNLNVKTPNGNYKSDGANGVSTKGGYFMAAFTQNFGESWKFDAKIRASKYDHNFNFFVVDGSGRNPLSQKTFVDSVAARPPAVPTSVRYTYANDGTTVNPNALILENNMVDRIRPLNEMAATFNLSKSFSTDKVQHTFNVGVFAAKTQARDFNFQYRYLSEFKDQPRLVNLSFVDGGVTKNYTVNGVVSAPSYTNKTVSSNKIAAFITDEIVAGKFRFDAGLRVESITGRSDIERSSTTTNADGVRVAWGNGGYDRVKVQASDWAIALAGTYQVHKSLNVYVNYSSGYFFPELRGLSVRYVGGVPAYPVYKPERINQGELGIKYGTAKLTATLAGYIAKLDNRLNVLFLNVNGAIVESAKIISSKSSGIEATFDYRFVKNFYIDGSLTLQQATYTKDETTPANIGKWLERQPRTMFTGNIGYDNKKFDMSFGTNYFSKRFGNASNTVTLDPYSIARLNIGYTFKLAGNESIHIGGGIFNVFNSEGVTEGNPRAGDAQTNTGAYFVGRPIIPRSFFFRTTLSF